MPGGCVCEADRVPVAVTEGCFHVPRDVVFTSPYTVLNVYAKQDCSKVVASKFFPVDGPEGKQHPLCETDYFRRLGLICAKCGLALRGSYITALGELGEESDKETAITY